MIMPCPNIDYTTARFTRKLIGHLICEADRNREGETHEHYRDSSRQLSLNGHR